VKLIPEVFPIHGGADMHIMYNAILWFLAKQFCRCPYIYTWQLLPFTESDNKCFSFSMCYNKM